MGLNWDVGRDGPGRGPGRTGRAGPGRTYRAGPTGPDWGLAGRAGRADGPDGRALTGRTGPDGTGAGPGRAGPARAGTGRGPTAAARSGPGGNGDGDGRPASSLPLLAQAAPGPGYRCCRSAHWPSGRALARARRAAASGGRQDNLAGQRRAGRAGRGAGAGGWRALAHSNQATSRQ